jgi:hypothetical protein
LWARWWSVSKTNSPLFCLSIIYIQKSLQRWGKYFFVDTEKISGLNSIYFHAKTVLSGDYFLAYFGLWSVIHSNRTRFIFSWTMNVTSFSPFLKFVHILWITWWFDLKMWMNTHIRWKYVECLPVENESTPWVVTVWHNVCRTLSCVHRKNCLNS